MLYEPPLVRVTPFLVQVYSTGGPPPVSPYRVKVWGVAKNDDDTRYTVLLVMEPRPVEKQIFTLILCHTLMMICSLVLFYYYLFPLYIIERTTYYDTTY